MAFKPKVNSFRKPNDCKVMLLGVKMGDNTVESSIKQAMEMYGYTVNIYRNINKVTRSQENNAILEFATPELAKQAIMELNFLVMPNSSPSTLITLISYPPKTEEEKLLLSTNCYHGLTMSGFPLEVSTDQIAIRIKAYYASLYFVKMSKGNDSFSVPKALLWFSDEKDRNLALQQFTLPQEKKVPITFGHFAPVKLDAQLLPPGVSDLPAHERSFIAMAEQGYGRDVPPTHCKNICGNPEPDKNAKEIKQFGTDSLPYPGLQNKQRFEVAPQSSRSSDIRTDINRRIATTFKDTCEPAIMPVEAREIVGQELTTGKDQYDGKPSVGRGRAKARRLFNI